jgi:hypothetical protein
MALNICSYHDIIESADSTMPSLPVINLDISALWGIPLTNIKFSKNHTLLVIASMTIFH